MIKIISPRKRVECVKYALVFRYIDDPGAGFSFPCDETGRVLDSLPPAGWKNLQKCVNNEIPVKRLGVQKYTWDYMEPAVGICKCGRRVTLDSAMVNPCDCGRAYNGFGQELAPYAQWGEETGESLADIYPARDPEEIGG